MPLPIQPNQASTPSTSTQAYSAVVSGEVEAGKGYSPQHATKGGGKENVFKRSSISTSTSVESFASTPTRITSTPANLPLSIKDKPHICQLQCLKVGEERLKIIQTVSVNWKTLAICLKFSDGLVQIIEHDHASRCEQACLEVFCRWLSGEGCQDISWETLIEALVDADRDTLAKQVRAIFKP